LQSGYDTFTVDISSLLAARQGQTLRLRFAEVDNVSFLNLGVDAVSLDAVVRAVPTPAPWLLAMPALLALAMRRRRPGTRH
jgi:MYXO-CTERM domain-containing protein